jgi:hypothetical protein
VIVGVDTATSRWHAVGRAPWLPPPGYVASKWQNKRLASEQARQPLSETFERYIGATVGLVGLLGASDEKVHLFVERPLALGNPKTNIALGLAAGSLYGQHLRHDVYWWWVEITTWQVMVGVTPGKDKSATIKAKSKAWAIEHVGLADDLDEDHYDAACIGEWGGRELEKLPGPWRPEAIEERGPS